MGVVFTRGIKNYGFNFVESRFLSSGEDEYSRRNVQLKTILNRSPESYRRLTEAEIKELKANGNDSPSWDYIYVSDTFDPGLIQDSFFAGLVRIGALEEGALKYHDYTQRTGIRGSTIISCDIGDYCSISHCDYISHYIMGNKVILSCVNEISATNHSKFGEGVIKQGEEESVRIWIEPRNEAGGRAVLPFYSLICADAYLWSTYRDDKKLMRAFKEITQDSVDSRRGYYGVIGEGCVIKHSRTIKDVRIEEFTYIKGANKLKNLTIKSCEDAPSQIGEGVELVNGVIGRGCHVFYGCKAVRFVLGDNCKLNYGARIINSILGDNSTISCCEVLNNLVFPAHEQHHNNSFLIAALVMGQSNLAAGATVGSNHNSRGADGEIIAGRGFWPGLSSALKHNSRFASFCLIAKGEYPSELNIPFPFSLVTNSYDGCRREVMPAYMWMYNMYALLRNSQKYKDRDKRIKKEQVYETDFLAPDTVKEIIHAIKLLEDWRLPNMDEENFYAKTRILERSKQSVRIIKPTPSIAAYKQMLVFYAIKTLSCYAIQEWGIGAKGCVYENLLDFAGKNQAGIPLDFENLGGQLVPSFKVEALLKDIREKKLCSWEEIHGAYRELHLQYPCDKAKNALAVLRFLMNHKEGAGLDAEKNAAAVFPQREVWNAFLDEALAACLYMEEQVYITKRKDYVDEYRNITYLNNENRDAILGGLEDNQFIAQTRENTAQLRVTLEKARA
ncbi:MAG: DUF4954 family protein [Spirochaetaceae bacterium]|jgi:NDP-sugar pyrophosphorylase family protein|nr:DUF4954 family protein [Spirochaetaceae bacterium]